MENIAFIGTGNMAEAIIGGLLQQGYPAANIRGTTHTPDSAARKAAQLGIVVDTDSTAAVHWADALVLAVKPQKLAGVCRNLAPAVAARKPLVISVAAGVTSTSIETWLETQVPLVRCMPNTPALLGQGVSGLFANPRAGAKPQALADRILGATGITHWVQAEEDLHLITAYCGSAPAYFYRFVESLMHSAEQQGMKAADAQALITQVALGAARMMTETGESPAALRARVSSPGGTTERALACFDEQGLDPLVDTAARACIDRSRVLAQELADAAPGTDTD